MHKGKKKLIDMDVNSSIDRAKNLSMDKGKIFSTDKNSYINIDRMLIAYLVFSTKHFMLEFVVLHP